MEKPTSYHFKPENLGIINLSSVQNYFTTTQNTFESHFTLTTSCVSATEDSGGQEEAVRYSTCLISSVTWFLRLYFIITYMTGKAYRPHIKVFVTIFISWPNIWKFGTRSVFIKNDQLFIRQLTVGGVKRFHISIYIILSALILLLWEVRGR